MSGSYPYTPGNSLTGPDPLVGSPEAPMMDQRVQRLQAHTPEEAIDYLKEPVYYLCTMQNASMFRKDGTRIIFQGGVFESNIGPTVRYLETEIGLGNPFIRHATPAEIEEYKMRRNPRDTIRQQVRAEIEAELRAKLEAEIMERLGMISGMQTGSTGTDNDNKAAAGIAGTDVAANLAAAKRVLRTDGATITMPNSASGNLPHLGGIVSSADIAGAASGSAGQSDGGATNFSGGGSAGI